MLILFIFVGLPEYNFPTLDPLFYEHATAVLKLGEIHGTLSVSNITAVGLSSLRFTDIRTHFLDNAFRLEVDADLPWLYAEAAVDVNGTLNVFRITGKGEIINSTQF